MFWGRFHYLCRKYNQLNSTGSDLPDTNFSSVLSDARTRKSTDLYGSKISEKSIADEILTVLERSDDIELISKSTSIYAAVNFDRSFEEPVKLRRVITYLSFLTVMYIWVSLIYRIFVMPQFLSMFESLEVPLPDLFAWYMNYSSYMIAVVVVLLLAMMCLLYQIRAIYSYKMPGVDSMLYNGLVPASIKNSFSSIIEIVTYPVSKSFEGKYQKSGLISAHFHEIEKSGLNLIVEIENLLRIESNTLNKKVELFVTVLISLVSVIIVASIVLFLMSAYSPLFIMGEGL